MPAHAPSVTTPVPAHPQLVIITTPLSDRCDGPVTVEYRAYNYRRVRTGKIVRADGCGLFDLTAVVVLGWYAWQWALIDELKSWIHGKQIDWSTKVYILCT